MPVLVGDVHWFVNWTRFIHINEFAYDVCTYRYISGRPS